MSSCGCGAEQEESLQRKTLIVLLSINAFMFVAELILGWFAQSTGLMADSIDMLADATVYGLSLYAVGKGITKQVKAARVSGYLQIILGIGVLLDVFRRLLLGSEPQSTLIIVVGTVALLANIL
ncbi:cation transporter, partial [Methylophaga sp.]|uniref:cation transporter n=1 Tax=Methylophaga sp. TaxID=2024840 RepID=UPI003F69C5B3